MGHTHMENSSVSFLIADFINDLKMAGKSAYTLVAYKKDLEQFSDHFCGTASSAPP
jgi:site-specific recombinase XerD